METRRSLAAAHLTLLFVVIAALAWLAYAWPTQPAQTTIELLATPALCLQTAVLLYLASTALLELAVSQSLRAGHGVQGVLGLPALLGHLWVLLVAAITAWRGAASRTLLAGLDKQLAVLVAISLLNLVLLLVTRRLVKQEAEQPDYQRGLGWLHAAISLAVVFALWYLETRQLE